MSHFYNDDGDLVEPWTKGAYPSPSTILDMIKNDGLAAFRARVGEELAEEHMVSARDRGTRVHKACEMFIKGNVREECTEWLEPDDIPYFDGFVNWCETVKPEFIASELFLINRKLRYAGTTDIVAKLDGQVWIIDIKTGVTRVKHGLQLKFYQEALLDMGLAKGTVRMGGLYLDPKRACGYRYFKSEFGLLEFKEPLAAIKAHLGVFRWWSKKDPIKKPNRDVMVWTG